MQIIRQKECTVTPFPCPQDMNPLVHRLLTRRGIDSAAAAERFLHPSESEMHDPFLLNDMAEAVTAIRSALEAGERICVYGDYDVDGVSASAILSDYLKSIHADFEVYIPSRHEEGYGLNENAIREIATRAKLMVTVDCGVTSCELVTLAKSLGLSCVVTDHHRPAEKLPDCPTVNPLLNGYPFGFLCGAGVAFKLVEALAGRDAAMRRIDIAALATVADIVALRDENRYIVSEGLRRMTEAPRPGIKALLELSGEPLKRITAETVGFRLGPRLNAAGRLGSARRAYDLLMAEDEWTAMMIASELEEENTRRKNEDRHIREAARRQLQGFDLTKHRAIVLAGEDWNAGVIGLAAAHIADEFYVPTILFSDRDGVLTGSCRSIPGVDIHAALTATAEHLVRYGGHAQAAGCTILRENLDAFIRDLDIWLHRNIPADVFIPVTEYDDECMLSEISLDTIEALEALEPTGCENPPPVFRASGAILEQRAVGKDASHLKLTMTDDGVRIGGVAFGKGHLTESLGDSATVLFTPIRNEFRGVASAEMRITTIEPGDYYAISRKRHIESDLQRDFLTQIFYNARITLDTMDALDIGEKKLAERLMRDPKGTLIVTSSVDETLRVLERVRPAQPDVTFGTMPIDPRGFNTVCCCPKGRIPAGYHCVVLAGVPAWYDVPDDAELLRLDCDNPWRDLLPDIDGFRRVYVQLKRTLDRPARRSTFAELCALIAPNCGVSLAGVSACLIALKDMELITLDLTTTPIRAEMKPMVKKDPEQNRVWKILQDWKNS